MPEKYILKDLLEKHDLKPKKLLGQNFLVDRNVLEQIIAAADLSKNDTVLEVGPGLGILTEELAKHAGRVVAVEKDKKMAEVVRTVLNDRKVKNVEIIEGDILKIKDGSFFIRHPDPPAGGEGSLENARPTFVGDSSPRHSGAQNDNISNYKLVANIPYYLTARLIRKFLESANPPTEMILMLQKEVAQRICAQPPKMSLLAVATQFYAEPKIISYVSKNSFWPSPKVDSAIIKMTPHRGHPEAPSGGEGSPAHAGRHSSEILRFAQNDEKNQRFFRIVKAGFAHPRKQLINNLSQGLKIDRTQIVAALKKIDLSPEQRAETLSIKDWIDLAANLF